MHLNRRRLIQSALATAAVGIPGAATSAGADPATRPIPSTGERLPLVGLGSWVTFNVGGDKQLLDESADVVAAFFAAGGRLIDSSPMYGSSQATIGYALEKLGRPKRLFSADKVWTSSASRGRSQIEGSRSDWRIPRFDLVQVHNLLSWEGHLETLQEMKRAGQVRYIGITTSHGRRHRDIEYVLSKHKIDFVQLTYNIVDRDVENRILPLARERDVAVIANRPFRRKALIEHTRRHRLPTWAPDTGATSWAQFLLKFIIAHPAITCAIPATTRTDHVRENLATAAGLLPDRGLRERMAKYVAAL